ncbi:DUF222 domain-containing protein [Brachybacterium sp.]|uniref:HNH endonuclease signature motif containing protein n=1 Tax=Brachybacterium sp. TaxID=1891286 RepID=UPI002ED4AE1D
MSTRATNGGEATPEPSASPGPSTTSGASAPTTAFGTCATTGPSTPTVAPGTSATQWIDALQHVLDAAPSLEQLAREQEGTLVDLLTAAEQAKARLAAVQARAETVFHDAQIGEQRRLGVPRDQLGRGIADQIALARRITPKQASNQLTLRRILVSSMPCTTALLDAGRISEWAAHKVAENALCLSDEDRATLDDEFKDRLPEVTANRAGDITRARAMELDPESAVRRIQRAASARRITLRPAADGMSVLRAVLPVKEGVASFDALTRTAKAAKSAGDPRSKGQIMADTLVERTTGAETVDDIPVEVQLLMTDTTLLGAENRTAWMDGHPVPGAVARDIALGTRTAARRELENDEKWMATTSSDAVMRPDHDCAMNPPVHDPAVPLPDEVTDAARWIRRLYTDPRTGELQDVDGRRRLFRGEVRRFILLRDQRCRTPFCDARIHDVDHAQRHADGGETTADNGVGHCQRFNLAKEIPGWSSTLDPATEASPGRLTIVTPTGHTYTSTSPILRRLLEGPDGEQARIIPNAPLEGVPEPGEQ